MADLGTTAGPSLSGVRAAAAQLNVSSTSSQANTKAHHDAINVAAAEGAQLIVFPECALTGYDFMTLEATRNAALTDDSSPIKAICEMSKQHEVVIVTGWLEQCTQHPDVIYNTVGIFQQGQLTKYRKLFVPDVSADQFVTPGNLGPVVCDTPFGVIGIAVCYDLRFPELTRVLWQQGMQILVVPTNWSATARQVAQRVVQARAIENGVPVVVANRGDQDSHSIYIGHSSITLANGEIIEEVQRGERLIIADIPMSDVRHGAAPGQGIPRSKLRRDFQRFAGSLVL